MGSTFPPTRCSVVLATRSSDPRLRDEAWSALVRAYWKPVYKYVRIVWNAQEDDARDLTQGFFTRALEAGFFQDYDPARARFRTYLRLLLQRWLSNEHKAAQRKKRGGGYRTVDLDFVGAERELAAAGHTTGIDADEYFRRETIRALFGAAVDDLSQLCEATGKSAQFAVFQRYDLHGDATERPTYRAIGEELGIPVTQVTNYLAWARRELRRIVLERLYAMTGTDAEFREEALELFGVEP